MCRNINADTPVIATVQIKNWLWRGFGLSEYLCFVESRIAIARTESCAVVTKCGLQVGGVCKTCFCIDEIIRCIKTWRPLGPQHVNECKVVGRHQEITQCMLEEKHVPTALQLCEVAHERRTHSAPWRYTHTNNTLPIIRSKYCCAVNGWCAPVMSDDYGVLRTTECGVKCICISAECGCLIRTIWCNACWCITTHKWCNCMKARIGKCG